MKQRYAEMDRKQKQLLTLLYPYIPDIQLWDSTYGGGYESRKFFNSPAEIEEFKELAAQEDVSLTKRQAFVVGAERTKNSPTIGLLDRCLKVFGDEFYRNALEKSATEFDPIREMRMLAVAQAARLEEGMKYEREVGLGNNAETEQCRAGYQSILKDLFEMEHGRKYDIHTQHSLSLSDEFMNMDFSEEDEYYDVDIIGDVDGE